MAHLYDPLHPAVLQLLAHVIRTSNKAGIPVAVCGEMAGDERLTRVLLGFGLRQFSMHPAHLLTVKQQVLKSDLVKSRSSPRGCSRPTTRTSCRGCCSG